MNLKAFGSNILIEPVVAVVDPNEIQEATAVPSELTFGIIVNIGSRAGQDLIFGQPSVQEKMKVLIAKDAGEEIEFEGKKYKVIQESHILCICGTIE